LAEGENKKSIKDVQKIYKSGKHLLDVIGDVLDLSSIEAGKLSLNIEPFSIQELIGEAIASAEILAKENSNTIESTIDGKLGQMISDKRKVKQSLFNLLSNANKFTKNGIIKIDAEMVSEKGEEWVRIYVTDTGIGIPEKYIKKLFEPFMQVDMTRTKQYGGTGLGLTITNRFCATLGGNLSVESKVEEGSRFGLHLPIDSSVGDDKLHSVGT
jgi:signal transduction histidine kinase